jgi:hypothetical protein
LNNRPASWRMLSRDELLGLPEARFGGVIAVIFCAAVLAFAPLVALIASGVRDTDGTTWVVLMMLRQALRGDLTSAYTAASLGQSLTLILWAASFIIITLFRVRNGPTITAAMFAISAAIGPASQFAIAAGFSADKGSAIQALSQLPHIALNLVTGVSFWAYMREGRRPNLYYRRRIRIESSQSGSAK